VAEAMGTDVVLETTRLTKIYRGQNIALSDVSLKLERGCVLGLIGPNGAGKTTLLRLILGLQKPTSGSVRIFGRRMTANAGALRRRIGYIPTHPRLPGAYTPMDYLEYVAMLGGMSARERRPRVPSLLRAVGLYEVAGDVLQGFSHGMHARLAVAASLVNDPELLIWDEPMHGLDPEARRSLFDLIKGLGDQRTMIVASHHLSDIDEICTHAAILSQGSLISFGTLDELREDIGCRNFEIEMAADNKGLITKSLQTIRSMNEVATCQLRGRRLALEVKEQSQNSAALANVFMELASNKIEVVGIHSQDAATETAFLTLVRSEGDRGFDRVNQDRAAA
jgi:ABC-2 type transport system ATP-binding protein